METKTKEKADTILKGVNLRRTGPREAVLSVLMQAKKPLSHEQIAGNLSKKKPNKVTIYRVLEKLVKTGLVHKAFLRERQWHFELANNCTKTQCHPHFTCTSCGELHCLTKVSLPMATAYGGFRIDHQRVQLEGLCPGCNRGRGEKNKRTR